MEEIKKWEEKIKWKDLVYMANKYKYDFQQYAIIRSFGESIYAGKINTDEAKMDQSYLLKSLVEFNKSRPRTIEGKDKKEILMKVHMLLVKVENQLLMLPKVEYFW